MLRLFKLLITLVMLGAALSVASAQNTAQLAPGDPPVASLISVSAPDTQGLVTVAGAAGAVFPGAQVAVRNLYTNDTVYVQAGLNGGFTASLYGPGNTAFWVSPAGSIPNSQRNQPGSLPGGPGTIVYGPFPQTPGQTSPVTQLVVDGDVKDWETYSNAAIFTETATTAYAVINQNSLYIALKAELPAEYTAFDVTFTLDGAVYNLVLDPRQQQLATYSRIQPNPRDLGTVAVAAAQNTAVEIRIPLAPVTPNNPTLEAATLEGLRFIGADGAEILTIPVQQNIPVIPEVDGIVRLNPLLGNDFTRFTISGTLANGTHRWMSRGRINKLTFAPGEQILLEMDVIMNTPDLPEGLVGLQMRGHFGLQPIIGADGAQTAGGLDSNNGWSDVLTPSGLAISGLRGDFILAETSTPATQVIRQGETVTFALDFAFIIPDDLPPGMYVPFFRGFGQVADGDLFRWEENSPLGSGTIVPNETPTRLPLVLNLGDVNTGRLVWTLFQDTPSDGSRGVLSVEDQTRYGLSNRVHFDSPTYILPPTRNGEPIAYPIEPYLLSQMPNAYDHTTMPLIPFLFPGGRLSARIARPDGQLDDLGSAAIVQNQLSTAAQDERTLFGAQSPVDIYRLTTLNALFSQYVFTQYGAYQINLTGNLEDVWGNRYEGGGTYTVLIAEPLDIVPGVLSGTPFEQGDTFFPGLHLSPGAPADVTITVRIYPLDESAMIEKVIEGQANAAGYFDAAEQAFTFETPGEYIIDYEARYTDSDGRLWAGSLRGAGVITNPSGSLIAHGQRGLNSTPSDVRPAWFSASQYAPDAPPHLNAPYHSGDVVWVPDGVDGQIKPIIQVQDEQGNYASWLSGNFPNLRSTYGLDINQLTIAGELPVTLLSPDNPYGESLLPDRIANQGYTYLSAVLPGVSARQFVQGGVNGSLPFQWDMNDPLNQQAGAGFTGSRPGDFVFLFGGAVVRNGLAEINETAAYAALGIIIDGEKDRLGPRVYPPYRGEAGGPNGGPLLVLLDEEINTFFHPTGIKPGDVLIEGDTLSIAGQVAPTLPSIVSVTVTSPDGEVRQFESTASAIGYFYNPEHDFTVDVPGIWTVQISVRHEGLTSAGTIEPPPPTGDLLGTLDGRFSVYVLPESTQPLDWNDTRTDFAIPAGIPYNFNFPLPATWTNVQVSHTVTMPGYLLAEGPLRVSGNSFSYQYNPTNLSRNFTNLENNGQGSGSSAADVLTFTFVASGTDENGRFQIRTRTFTISHDRLTTFG